MLGMEAMSPWEMRDGTSYVQLTWIGDGTMVAARSHCVTLLGQLLVGDIGFMREFDI